MKRAPKPKTRSLDTPEFTLGHVLKLTGLETISIQNWIGRHLISLETPETPERKQNPGTGKGRRFTLRDVLRLHLMGELIHRRTATPSGAALAANTIFRPGFETEIDGAAVRLVDCIDDNSFTALRYRTREAAMQAAAARSVDEAAPEHTALLIDASGIYKLLLKRVADLSAESLPPEKRGHRRSKGTAEVNRTQEQTPNRKGMKVNRRTA